MAGSVKRAERARFAPCSVRASGGEMALAGYVALDPVSMEEGATLLSRMLDAFERPGAHRRHTVANADFGFGVRSARPPYRSPRGRFAAVVDGGPRFDPVTRRAGGEGGGGPAPHEGALLELLHDRLEEQTFSAIEGPYAIAVWDGRARRLLLGRDRWGQRPLVVAWAKGGRLLLFASEAKAILASGRVERRFDGRALLDVFSLGHPLPGRTLFSGVRDVGPGTWLSLDLDGRLAEGRWARPPMAPWSLERPDAREAGSLTAALTEALARTGAGRVWLDGTPPSAALAAASVQRAPGGGLRTVSGRFASSASVLDPVARRIDRLAETLEAEHAEVVHRPLDEEAYVGTLRALETPLLDVEAGFAGQVWGALASLDPEPVLLSDGAELLLSGPLTAAPRRGPGVLERWGLALRHRDLPGLARAVGRSGRLARALGRRAGASPAVEDWIRTAHVADALLRLAPPGLARYPHELGGPARLADGAFHRRLLVALRLGYLEQRMRRSGRQAARFGIELHRPFLDEAVLRWWTAQPADRLARGAALRAALPRALRWSGRWPPARRSQPSPRWPFGPGAPRWVTAALAEPALDRVGFFDAKAVEVMRQRASRPDAPASAELEARVLRGVLGVSLLAAAFGVEGVDGAGRPQR